MTQLRNWLLVCLLAVGSTARAQTANDSDFDLLYKTKNPPPNIAILLDDSGSMANAVWVSGFDPYKFYDTTAVTDACSTLTVDTLAGTCKGSQSLKGDSSPDDDPCPDSDGDYITGNFSCSPSKLPATVCSTSNFPVATGTNPASSGWTCTATSSSVKITPPQVTLGGYSTRWSKNYLAWIIWKIKQNQVPGLPYPQKDRIETAKQVLKDTINQIADPNDATSWNKVARFGLWGFNTAGSTITGTYPNRADTNGSKGALLHQGIGVGTRADLMGKIDGMYAQRWTPLGESLLDVARAMSGNPALGTSADLKSGTPVTGAPMADVACAKNFVLILTDGAPTMDNFNPGPVGVTQAQFLASIGDADHVGQDPKPPGFGPPLNEPDYTDTGTDWLDDIAYYIFRNDLRPEGMQGSGALPGVQNISTYVVGFNVKIPLLKNTAINGDGKFFVAQSAQDLDDAIKAAVIDILSRAGSFSAASVPSTRTRVNDALFTAFFEPVKTVNFWAGHLQSYKIIDLPQTDPNGVDITDFTIVGNDGKVATDPVTGEFFEPRTTFFWDAAKCLNLTDPNCNNTTRNVFYNKGATSPVRTVFNTTNVTAAELTIDPNELTAYPPNPAGGAWTQDTLKNAVTSFVLGEDAFNSDGDANTLVTVRRAAVLGDIFHSNPLAVGGVPVALAGEPGFGPILAANQPPSFYDQFYKRSRVIYAGANDGMVHAFDAGVLKNPDLKPLTGDESYEFGTGKELFGYIPNTLLKGLKELVKNGVAKPFLMDGAPAAADAWLPSTATDVSKDPNEWATVLVQGMRNGGDGYLALDITDPNATSGAHGPFPKLLWEFNDPNEFLGKTWSTPVITRVKIRAGVGGDYCGQADDDGKTSTLPADCQETWVAVFSGGYLEQGDPMSAKYIADPNNASWTKDSRSIYLVRMDNGKVLARVARDPLDAQLKFMTFSIPAQPSVADLDNDGFADVIYVGDTGGQMWKWDISKVATPDVSTKLVPTSEWPIGRVFVAPVASNGHLRSFYNSPSISLTSSNAVRLAFGSGERTKLDFDSAPTVDANQFYVLEDRVPTGPGAFSGLPRTLANLTKLLDSEDKDSNLSDYGFYFEPSDDEKFVTDPVTFEGFVVVLSFDPDVNVVPPLPVCEQGGHGVLWAFSIIDGHGFFTPQGLGEKARHLSIGRGLPTNPRISQLGKTTHIVVQTPVGIIAKQGPKGRLGDSQTIYWRVVF